MGREIAGKSTREQAYRNNCRPIITGNHLWSCATLVRSVGYQRLSLMELDLFELQQKTWKARAKWHNIGLGLKISEDELDVIDKDNDNIEDKFRGMLRYWRRNGENCTLEALCSVLEAECVGHRSVADEIRRQTRCDDAGAPDPRPEARPEPPAQTIVPQASQKEMPTTKEDNGDGQLTQTFVTLLKTASLESSLADLSKSPEMSEAPTNIKGHALVGLPTPQVLREEPLSQKPCAQSIPQDLCSNPGAVGTGPVVVQEFCAGPLTNYESPKIISPKEFSLQQGIKLRGYQEELVAPGLQGKNCIVVAPTGTGKTLVAGYIIMHHLNKMLRVHRKGKVALMTPTRHLAFQQKTKLQEYIPGIRVVEITGAESQPMQPLIQSNLVDVIVCTAGKLRLELKTKGVKVNDFSLIIADECHHAGRPSSYSDIMEFYIRSKLAADSSILLPQVVGFTASPGAGRGKSNIVTVLDHQVSLCATMDATGGIVTVGENITELESIRNAPQSHLQVGGERSFDDPFIVSVSSAMSMLESFIGPATIERGSSKYDSWLQNEKEAAENREVDERIKISVLDQLSVYSQCLMTYHDFRHEDAVSVLQEVKEFSDQTSFEHCLFQTHKELMEKLSHLPKTPNPLLVDMESVLLEQFVRLPRSKGIFFVREVKHTRYVTNWIRSSPTLSRIIRVAPITGHSNGGMDKSEQLRVLEGFRNETYNLLASTSVLEEGLDVPECNFVIRYQNVSNEIAQVQAKGRARAQDSRIYTVVSSDSNKDYWYLVQEEKQRLVEQSVNALKGLQINELVYQKQKSFIEDRDRNAQHRKSLRSKWSDTNKVEILCKNCKVVACKGSDIFAYDLSCADPQYVVPGKFFSVKYDKRENDKTAISDDFAKPYRIYCRSPNCRNRWGIIGSWGDTGYKLPVLK